MMHTVLKFLKCKWLISQNISSIEDGGTSAFFFQILAHGDTSVFFFKFLETMCWEIFWELYAGNFFETICWEIFWKLYADVNYVLGNSGGCRRLFDGGNYGTILRYHTTVSRQWVLVL